MQKVIRTYPEDYKPSQISYPNGGFTPTGKLNIALEQGYSVVTCNTIHFSDGGMCLEYIVEKTSD